VFISYSRKDYYFAESLAFHLERDSVRVWLDAKDLEPGADWQEQLETALDNASCVLVVISGDSAVRPAVHMEWERALAKGKRIVVVMFRKTKMPAALAHCELVDFRSSFGSALQLLIQKLSGGATDAPPVRSSLPVPPWILAITLTLLIPLLCYFSLADWSSSDASSQVFKIVVWSLMPLFVGGFFWFLCFSFLRRRMGMTHLAVSFAFPAIWCIYPLVRYWLAGPANIAGTWLAVLQRNPFPMEVGSVVTLAGIGIVLLVRPDDLLRWTPTGKAWGFYREGCLAKFAGVDRPSALRHVKRYSLLYDAVDEPAAKRLGQELDALGASECIEDATSVLLLTSRTHTDWLAQQMERLRSKVLVVVGTRIGLPEQLDWLWRREWIDFRHWDLQRLDRKRGLLQVPEAVTGVRYPTAIRVAHHLLCALAAASFCMLPLADPETFKQGHDSNDLTPTQNWEMVFVMAICAWCIVFAQKLLNRTVSEPTFKKAWGIGLAASCLFAIWVLPVALHHGQAVWQVLGFAVFLLGFPIMMLAKRKEIAFWFPTPSLCRLGTAARLKTGPQRQTLLWVVLYLFVFWYLAGMYRD